MGHSDAKQMKTTCCSGHISVIWAATLVWQTSMQSSFRLLPFLPLRVLKWDKSTSKRSSHSYGPVTCKQTETSCAVLIFRWFGLLRLAGKHQCRLCSRLCISSPVPVLKWDKSTEDPPTTIHMVGQVFLEVTFRWFGVAAHGRQPLRNPPFLPSFLFSDKRR